MNKSNLYELNLNNIFFWKKTIIDGIDVFVKSKLDSFTILLDNVNNDYYMDIISGRLIEIKFFREYLSIIPSDIETTNDSLILSNNVLEKADIIVNNFKNEYVSISDDILYNTYFCNAIYMRCNLDVIPVDLVEMEIMNLRNFNRQLKTTNKI